MRPLLEHQALVAPRRTRVASQALLCLLLCLSLSFPVSAEAYRSGDSPYGQDRDVATDSGTAELLAAAAGKSTGTGGGHTAASEKITWPGTIFNRAINRQSLDKVPKWLRVRDLERAHPSFTDSGIAGASKKMSKEWVALQKQLDGASIMEKLQRVNVFFNRMTYRSDLDIWRLEDYWATPREFMQKSGDCEDYAIAKYYALRHLGVSADRMRIAAVKDSIRGIGHAILIVWVDNDIYVLDNLSSLILSHTRYSHYTPKYAVNEKHHWGFMEFTRIVK